MSAEPQQTTETPQQAAEETSDVLYRQQEADASDEEYLSDSAQVVDANDISEQQFKESLDMDLSRKDQKIWLVRLPRFLAERWRDKELLDGQELGKIKIRKQPVKGKDTIKLELDPLNPMSKDIPFKYSVDITKSQLENQYVFTEESLTKYARDDDEYGNLKIEKEYERKFGERKRFNQDNNNDSSRDGTPQPGQPQEKKRRFNRFKNRDGTDKTIPFVKTIPKKTSLIGKIVHECQVVPSLKDPNYSKIIAQRKQLLKEEPRPTVTLLDNRGGIASSNMGLSLRNDTSKFLKAAPTKSKAEGRAIRMPQKDLFDMLFKMFDEYDYWSLKGIKERTQQPEIYLKETLDQIANLIKKGPYALKYALKKEYKELKDKERAAKLGELGEVEEPSGSEEEENEDEVEMEDVV